MGENPFMLVYGSKAMIPVEVTIYTHRLVAFQTTMNNQALQEALNLRPLVRGDAYLHDEVAKARMTHFYNLKLMVRPLAVGGLVL